MDLEGEDGKRSPSSNEYEAICEFFGWPDAQCRACGCSRRGLVVVPTKSVSGSLLRSPGKD